MKFAPIREKRQELYNIEDYSLMPFNFNGIDKQIYSNVNLSIFVDDYCNADCKFCVAQLRFENRNQTFKKDKIKNDAEYFKRIDEILENNSPTENPVLPLHIATKQKETKWGQKIYALTYIPGEFSDLYTGTHYTFATPSYIYSIRLDDQLKDQELTKAIQTTFINLNF